MIQEITLRNKYFPHTQKIDFRADDTQTKYDNHQLLATDTAPTIKSVLLFGKYPHNVIDSLRIFFNIFKFDKCNTISKNINDYSITFIIDGDVYEYFISYTSTNVVSKNILDEGLSVNGVIEFERRDTTKLHLKSSLSKYAQIAYTYLKNLTEVNEDLLPTGFAKFVEINNLTPSVATFVKMLLTQPFVFSQFLERFDYFTARFIHNVILLNSNNQSLLSTKHHDFMNYEDGLGNFYVRAESILFQNKKELYTPLDFVDFDRNNLYNHYVIGKFGDDLISEFVTNVIQ
jgi:hypothetical protein